MFMCKILMINYNSGHVYILYKYSIFCVLKFFCIRRYQKENLEFSENYLYELYNVLQAGCTFILMLIFQIISGEILENHKC